MGWSGSKPYGKFDIWKRESGALRRTRRTRTDVRTMPLAAAARSLRSFAPVSLSCLPAAHGMHGNHPALQKILSRAFSPTLVSVTHWFCRMRKQKSPHSHYSPQILGLGESRSLKPGNGNKFNQHNAWNDFNAMTTMMYYPCMKLFFKRRWCLEKITKDQNYLFNYTLRRGKKESIWIVHGKKVASM